VYAPGDTTPARTIADVPRASAIAFDAEHRLYVAFGNQGLINVYAPDSTTLVRTLNASGIAVASLVFDAHGNLYAGRVREGIAVFPPGASSPERVIATGPRAVTELLVDSEGDLYALEPSFYPGMSEGRITVYAPGGSTAIRKYAYPLSDDPRAMALDPERRLCVGIAATKHGMTAKVQCYEAGSTYPWRGYGDLGQPSAMAFDAGGDLYVADFKRNDIYIYKTGGLYLWRRITDDLDKPRALVLDAAGDVYAANEGNSTVTVYRSGTKTLLRTISSGLKKPMNLMWGP
jgi:DNA-binding beta-propeller fold protein YncE